MSLRSQLSKLITLYQSQYFSWLFKIKLLLLFQHLLATFTPTAHQEKILEQLATLRKVNLILMMRPFLARILRLSRWTCAYVPQTYHVWGNMLFALIFTYPLLAYLHAVPLMLTLSYTQGLLMKDHEIKTRVFQINEYEIQT